MEDILTVAVKKIVGQPNPKGGKWSNVLDFEPSEPRLRKTRGRLFAVLDLTGSSKRDLSGFGQETLAVLRHRYYEADEDSPFKSLEAAVKEAQHRLVELVFGPGAVVSDGALNYNLAVCSLWGKVLYIAKLGSASIYLYRHGVLKELGREAAAEIFLASGVVEPQDSLILGTSEFRNSFSPSDFPRSDDDLEAQIRGLGSPPGVSVLILTFSLESVPGEAETVRIEPVPKSPQRFLSLSRLRRFLKPLGLVFFLLSFLTASFWTVRKRQAEVRTAEAARSLAVAEEQVSDARSYVDLNNLRARELLLLARKSLSEVPRTGGEVLGVVLKMAEIDSLLDQVNKVRRVKLEKIENPSLDFNPLAELISPPEADATVVDVGTYLANVYFLVPSKNQILRYVPVEEGEYALPQEWVKEEADLSDAISLALDGFIYVLKADGQILKFEKGELWSDFAITGLDQPFNQPRAIFTTVESEHLYVLDGDRRRVVVFDKNGLYQSQYLYEDVVDLKDFLVDEVPGFIYLTDGISLYRVEI